MAAVYGCEETAGVREVLLKPRERRGLNDKKLLKIHLIYEKRGRQTPHFLDHASVLI